MTTRELIDLFEKHSDNNYCEFRKIPMAKRASHRADMHAFKLLDMLVPSADSDAGFGAIDMVSAAEHDEVWLGVELEELAKVITEDQVIELLCCGVRADRQCECLAMFV